MGEKGDNGDYMLIVGGGKVGWNLARELIDKGHEVTLIEADRDRYLTVEQELRASRPLRRRLLASGPRAGGDRPGRGWSSRSPATTRTTC